MPLDRLIRSREQTPVRHAALNLNFPLAPDGYRHTPMTGTSSAHNPVLRRRIFDPSGSADTDTAALGMELAAWVLRSVKLPPEVKKQITGAMDAARTRHPSLP